MEGTFVDFLREFKKVEWEKISDFSPRSIFNHKLNSEIHAGIIKFNNVGMIMKTKKDYDKAMKWVDFFIDEDKEIYDWSLQVKMK